MNGVPAAPPKLTPRVVGPTTPTSLHLKRNTWWWGGGLALLVLIALALVAAFKSPSPNQGIPAASALLLISAAAVGIERGLEVFWTFVDNTAGSFWPFSAFDRAITSLVDGLTDETAGPLARLTAAVDEATEAGGAAASVVAGVPAEIQSIRNGVDQLQQLAPTSDRAKVIADYTTRGLNEIAKRYPAVDLEVGVAVQSVSAVSEFVDSLADNPGRRILSIYFGILIGLGVVLALGLDVLNATLGVSLDVTIAGHTFFVGIAATGLVVGLGANPTHELIKLLQTIKENQKA